MAFLTWSPFPRSCTAKSKNNNEADTGFATGLVLIITRDVDKPLLGNQGKKDNHTHTDTKTKRPTMCQTLQRVLATRMNMRVTKQKKKY